uniref:Coatomer subunit beta n=1 Tax=Leptocylindrus danicus TaxID=163516 RepID=A0A7S2PNF9_9STRA
MAMLSGESMPKILMQVIRFCINTNDHKLKKLMMLYWEVVPKYEEPTSAELLADPGGKIKRKLLPEMILVCNALRNDLIHPNEYVRGSMLRFLCKVKDEEILGPLIPSIKQCLEHRHPYVRKNAALAIFHVHKLHGDNLLPDAPEVMEAFLLAETDVGARRNAFLMLFNQAEDLAIQYLASNIESVMGFGDGFSLLVLELTRRVCRKDANQKSRFVRVLFAMLTSESSAVSYEAAWTMISLSSSPTAIRAAANTYASLLNNPQSDNNVKMIVLERLDTLKKKHPKIVQEILMDILRALATPNIDVCKKVLTVVMDIVSSRNVQEVVTVLKREVNKTAADNNDATSSKEKGVAYRSILIQAIHSCATKFPDVAESVVHALMDFLGGGPETGSIQVILFVRAIVEQYPSLRESLLNKLTMNLEDITSSGVMCVSLWILGEYCNDSMLLKEAFEEITNQLGEAPYLLVTESADNVAKEESAPKKEVVTKNVVLSDGTYATQTAYSEHASAAPITVNKASSLRKMIVGGDVFLGSVVANCLTKLCLKAENASEAKKMTIKTVLTMCGIVKMAELTPTAHRSSVADCKDRISVQCRALMDPKARKVLKDTIINKSSESFAEFLKSLNQESASKEDKEDTSTNVQADDMIHFRQLRANAAQGGDIDLDDGTDLQRATGGGDSSVSELKHVYQLSGFADPVYAEALVTVHDYDIVLEMLVINRTPNTLSNLTVELATMGDMKIVERPQSCTIGPLDQTNIRASIKVSSTETGHIFGTIVYEDGNTKGYINLNDIHMDIMDYIRPAFCTDDVFRSMWAEFEWENKVAISTTIEDLTVFLDHIVAATNMRCLTEQDRSHVNNFLAANLYARSVFGEDALVNVSVEKKSDGKLGGYIRIRSKTQGIALSLGDRITNVQRALPEKKSF